MKWISNSFHGESNWKSIALDASAQTVLPVLVVTTWKKNIYNYILHKLPSSHAKTHADTTMALRGSAEMLVFTRSNSRNNGATVPISHQEKHVALKYLPRKGLHSQRWIKRIKIFFKSAAVGSGEIGHSEISRDISIFMAIFYKPRDYRKVFRLPHPSSN